MAKRSLQIKTFTPTATADTTDLVDDTYFGVIQGGSSTQRVIISEIYLGGQATASAPTIMVLARDSTIAVTVSLGTNQTDAPLDSATAALAAATIVGNTATTKPQRAATLSLLNVSFNAFGGIVRWVAADEKSSIMQAGNAVNLGETSLSAFTGGTPGLMGGHVIYEAL